MPRFLGRQAELQSLCSRLDEPQRLICVFGPPGIGKSRLVLELCSCRPCIYCDLTAAVDADGLVRTVAEQLLPSDQRRGVDLTVAIADALAQHPGRPLIFDNFEQLTDALPLLRGWLKSAPQSQFVVTSRFRLQCPEETVLEVLPLGLDANGESPSDAAQLFVECAGGVEVERFGSPDERLAVERICGAVGGVPLAIGLVAGLAELWSAEELWQKLQADPEWVAHRTLRHERHPSIHAAIEWSWTLLDTAERRALTCLATTRGGFSPHWALKLLRRSAPDAQPNAEELLASLCSKSFLHADKGEKLSSRRLELYPSVREFVEKRADSAELASARQTHAAVVIDHCAPLARALQFPTRGESADPAELALEASNLIAVAERAASGDVSLDHGLDALWLLEPVLSAQSSYARQLQRIADVMARVEGSAREPNPKIARALLLSGRLCRMLGRYDRAVAELERGLENAAACRDVTVEGRLRSQIVLAQVLALRHEQAQAQAASALRCLADRDSLSRGFVYGFIGLALRGLGKIEAATEHFQKAHDILAHAGNVRGRGIARGYLADLARHCGRFGEAADGFPRALEDLRQSYEHQYFGIHATHAAELYCETGDFEQARQCVDDAVAALTRVGDRHNLVSALVLRAMLERSDVRAIRDDLQRASSLADAGAHGDLSAIADLGRVALDMVLRRQAGIASARADFYVSQAERRIAQARRHALLPRCYELRLALRRALALLPAPLDRGADTVFRLDTRTWSLSIDGAPSIDLRRRGSTRRVLECLVRARLQSPGKPVSSDQLRSAGWPDDSNIHPDSAANRLYVAVATIRRWGLGDALVRDTDGYLIATSARVTLV